MQMDSFVQLVEKYNQVIFRCAYSYCNNREDAEDVLQEVFCKYLQKQPLFENENHERAWFLRVTINVSKNHVRSFWRRKVEALTEGSGFVSEEDLGIWMDVQSLPLKYRTVIQLHYGEGLTLKEIAEILDANPSTIGTRLERAKGMLRKMWKEA